MILVALLFAMVGMGVTVALGSVAWSMFENHGDGHGTIAIGTLSAPLQVSASFPDPSQRSTLISWNAAQEATGEEVQGYYVERYLNGVASPACATSPSVLVQALSCTEDNLDSNTYTYRVVAVFRSWSAGAVSGPVSVPASHLSSLSLVPSSSSPSAGSTFTVAVTATDQYGAVDRNYTGSQCLTFAGASNAPSGNSPIYPVQGLACPNGSLVTFDHGVASGPQAPSVTLFNEQATTLSATDDLTQVAGSTDLNVGPGAFASLQLAPSTATPVAGPSFSVALSALDRYGNIDTNYSGAQCLDFTGAASAPDGTAPSYPSAGTCATGSSVVFDHGVASGGNAATLTLFDAAPTTLVVNDAPTQLGGTSVLGVGPSALNALVLAPSTPTPVAGESFSVAINAYDQYFNCLLYTSPSPRD